MANPNPINAQTGMALAYYGYFNPDPKEFDPAKATFEKPDGWKILGDDDVAKFNLTNGWNTQVNASGKVENQFQVLVNPDAKQIVISFKGSDAFSNWISDLGNSGASEFAKISQKADAAYAEIFAATAPGEVFDGYQIVTAGHSLGGGMAQTFAVKHGLDAYVYNSLPIPYDSIVSDYFKIANSTYTGAESFSLKLASWLAENHKIVDVRTPNDIATFFYSNLRDLTYLTGAKNQAATMLPGAEMPTAIKTILLASVASGAAVGLATLALTGLDHTMGNLSDGASGLGVNDAGQFVVPQGANSLAEITPAYRAQLDRFNKAPISKVTELASAGWGEIGAASGYKRILLVEHTTGASEWVGIADDNSVTVNTMMGPDGYDEVKLFKDTSRAQITTYNRQSVKVKWTDIEEINGVKTTRIDSDGDTHIDQERIESVVDGANVDIFRTLDPVTGYKRFETETIVRKIADGGVERSTKEYDYASGQAVLVGTTDSTTNKFGTTNTIHQIAKNQSDWKELVTTDEYGARWTIRTNLDTVTNAELDTTTTIEASAGNKSITHRTVDRQIDWQEDYSWDAAAGRQVLTHQNIDPATGKVLGEISVTRNGTNALVNVRTITIDPSTGIKQEQTTDYNSEQQPILETRIETLPDNSQTITTTKPNRDETIVHKTAEGVTDRTESRVTDPDSQVRTDTIKNFDPITGAALDVTTMIETPNGDKTVVHQTAGQRTDWRETYTRDSVSGTQITTHQNIDPATGKVVGETSITRNGTNVLVNVRTVTIDPSTGIKQEQTTDYNSEQQPILETRIETLPDNSQTITSTTPSGDKTIVHKTADGSTDRVETQLTDPETRVRTDTIRNLDPRTGELKEQFRIETFPDGKQTWSRLDANGVEEWRISSDGDGFGGEHLTVDQATMLFTITQFDTQATTFSRYPQRQDPFTLDLNGNGILDTKGIDPANPIYFDLNGNGSKQPVGWVQSGDGFLVLDRNNNGIIDSGVELFGDATPIFDATGKATTAVDGFQALASLDSNGDGLIDANDAAFTNITTWRDLNGDGAQTPDEIVNLGFADLKVWRDLNQDGVSQADELQSLSDAGIKSLTVARREHSTILGNGNEIADLGSFTRIDGSSGGTGTVGQLADINLAVDTFHSQFTDTLPISDLARTFPDLQGSGQVRSLREAASMDTEAGRTLARLLTLFNGTPDRTVQLGLMDAILKAWSDTSTMATTFTGAYAGHQLTVDMQAWYGGVGFNPGGADYSAWAQKLTLIEHFMGRTYQPVPEGNGPVSLTLWHNPRDLLQQAYDALKTSVFNTLANGAQAQAYLNQVQLHITDSGITLDFSAIRTGLLTRAQQGDLYGAVSGLINFQMRYAKILDGSDWDGNALLQEIKTQYPMSSNGETYVKLAADLAQWTKQAQGVTTVNGSANDDILDLHVSQGLALDSGSWQFVANDFKASGLGGNDRITGADGSNQLDGGDGNDTLLGGVGNDTLLGGAGDDSLVGGEGRNRLEGGAGNDNLAGGTGGDILLGGAGNDSLAGGAGADSLEGGDGNDTLVAGPGNDTLAGGSGSDTYLYKLGDGSVTISESATDQTGTDVLKFGAGIKASDLSFRFGSTKGWSDPKMRDLVISIAGRSDTLTLQGFFSADGNYGGVIESFQFADGKVLRRYDVRRAATDAEATAGNDVIYGTAWDDYLVGGTGNDTIYGYGGGDVILGGNGNDSLIGSASDDDLEGGAGDDVIIGGGGGMDYLYGNAGNDTIYGAQGASILYNLGDGNDTIYAQTPTGGQVIVDLADIAYADVTITAANKLVKQDSQGTTITGDLKLTMNATGETVTLVGAIDWDSTGRGDRAVSHENIELRFGDGTILNQWDIMPRYVSPAWGQQVLTGTAGNDVITTGKGWDIVNAGDGDDVVDGGLGRDSLHGGIGNDLIQGGEDNDFLYGEQGDDTLLGGAGDDLFVDRYGFNLLDGGAGNDSIEGFGDFSGGDGNDTLNGVDAQADQLFDGGSGDDLIHGGHGNDSLLGGEGNDSLSGDGGNDNLIGGYGNDTLAGGEGDDAYIFQRGDGNDRIDDWSGNETFRFQDAIKGQITISTTTNDIVLKDIVSGDTVTLSNWNVSTNVGSLRGTVQFADGQQLTYSDLRYRIDGYRSVYGDANPNLLIGTPDPEAIYGMDGNDTLVSSAGGDTLSGGDGDDTYLINKGAGSVTIDMIGGSSSYNYLYDKDVLQFGSGITWSNFLSTTSGNDLLIQAGGVNIIVPLWDAYLSGNGYANRVSRIVMSDGSFWNVGSAGNHGLRNYVSSLTGQSLSGGDTADTIVGGNGADTIYGGDGNDAVEGGAGADLLYGGAGNDVLTGDGSSSSYFSDDTLDGGAGDDTLYGGAGDDTYLFGLGDGHDRIVETGGTSDRPSGSDTLTFKMGIPPGDVVFGRPTDNPSNLRLAIKGTDDYVELANWFVSTDSRIESVKFSDGTIWSVDQLAAAAVVDFSGVRNMVFTPPIDTGSSTGSTPGMGDGTGGTSSPAAGDSPVGGSQSGTTTTSPNHHPVGTVSIDGAGIEDQPLTAIIDFSDADGIGEVHYQWQRSIFTSSVTADITGATSSIYAPTDKDLDVNQGLQVVASYVDGLGNVESVTSDMIYFIQGVANHSPSGRVSISGTPTQGYTLTAGNTIYDPDGMIDLHYQWQSSTDGMGWQALSGATEPTLALKEGNVGSLVRLVASYYDGKGNLESMTSSPTVPIANVNDAPVGKVSVVGSLVTGNTLLATAALADADGLGDISFQWERSYNGISWVSIDGATGGLYSLSGNDVGYKVRATASYVDGHGTFESVSSDPTRIVAAVDSAPTGTVSISGQAVQGQKLTASNALYDADGIGSISYTWQQQTDGNWQSIAKGIALTLAESNVGRAVRVVAEYTDGLGKAEAVASNSTLPIGNVNDAPSGKVFVSGNAKQSEILTASSALYDLDGIGVISYQWESSSNGVDWLNLQGGIGRTFTPGEAQRGQFVRVVASYVDGHGTSESVISAPTTAISFSDTLPIGNVTITGSAVQNQVLTAHNTLYDPDGMGPVSYLWESSIDSVNWVSLSNGSGNQFALTAYQVGTHIRVTATYVDGLGYAEAVSSGVTGLVAQNNAPTGVVNISGALRKYNTVTASNNLADLDGIGAISYLWQSSQDGTNWTAISDTSSVSLYLNPNLAGKNIRVIASYTDGVGHQESVASAGTTPILSNNPPQGVVLISGSQVKHQTLTASNNLSDLDGLGTITYEWQVSSDGANWVPDSNGKGASLSLGSDEVGKRVRVLARYNDADGAAESVVSNSTSVIVNANAAPSGILLAEGSARQNQLLTAVSTLTDNDGMGPLAFQWQATLDGVHWANIFGAVTGAVMLSESQVGQKVRVVASYKDGGGTTETVVSAVTQTIANINDVPTGDVLIQGVVAQGQNLTVTNTLFDPDGLGVISYQWQHSIDGIQWLDLANGNGTSYVPGEPEVNQRIRVVANYIDGHGTHETVPSGQTLPVENVNDSPIGNVVINGVPAQNQTLVAGNTLSDPDGIGTTTYEWQTSDDGSVWHGIFSGSSNSFTLTEAEVGKQVRVVASYVDGHGTVESVASMPSAQVANVNDAPAGSVTVTGDATQSQTLAIIQTLSDADGLGSVSYQWQSAGAEGAWSNINGATSATLTLAEAQVGLRIRAVANYVDGHGAAEAVISNETGPVLNVNDLPTGIVTITGTIQQNQSLNASNSLWDADGMGAIGYQWQASSDGIAWVSIDGATSNTLSLTADQVGRQVRVLASYMDGHGTAENVASVSSGVILPASSGGNGNDTLMGGGGADSMDGGAGNDVISGGAGNDTLSGGVGIDLLRGGEGDDVFLLSKDADWVAGYACYNAGSPGHAGSGALVSITGKARSFDVMDGGPGFDMLAGTSGSDIIVLEDSFSASPSGYVARFSSIEAIQAGAGDDIIDMTSTLFAYGDILLDGGDGNDVLWSSSGNDSLIGGNGNDSLDGGWGSDTMSGGQGNDTYWVDNAADQVRENLNEGTDAVIAGISYWLDGNVENLTLTGASAVTGSGNGLNNSITGNGANNILSGGDGNDTLNGAAGADTLSGGVGNDVYVVDNAFDIVIENLGEGTDVVQSAIDYVLGPNLENLSLTGSTAKTGTGNELNNSISGNSANNLISTLGGNDTLNGGAGADTLIGGTGNDTYVVDNVGDVVSESADEGLDVVQASISCTLAANVENLTLTGSVAIDGTGNDLNNSITGNAANNVLKGGAGNDTLSGGAGSDQLLGGTGSDVLNGGAGADVYTYLRGDGQDSVADSDATAGVTDVAQFGADIAFDQLWFRHVGNNLELNVIGTTDKLTIQNWYSGAANHVEQFKAGDGKLLVDTDVEKLVQAMAAFAPPAAGQTTLPTTYQSSLAPVLAANWH